MLYPNGLRLGEWIEDVDEMNRDLELLLLKGEMSAMLDLER